MAHHSGPNQLHPLGRSCSGEAATDFQPADDNFDLHRPLVSLLDFLPPATAVRPAVKPGQQVPSQSGTTVPHRHLWSVSHHHQKRVENLPWTFSAALAHPRVPRERKGHHKEKQKRQRSRRRQRRWPKSRRHSVPMAGEKVRHRRDCSDTMEETSFDEALLLRSNLRSKRERNLSGHPLS